MRRGTTIIKRSLLWAALCLAPAGAQDYGNRLGLNELDRVSYYASAPSMRGSSFMPSLKRP